MQYILDEKEYKKTVRNIVLLFEAKKSALLKTLEKEMTKAAKSEHFEEAEKQTQIAKDQKIRAEKAEKELKEKPPTQVPSGDRLSDEDLIEIGNRMFSKLSTLDKLYGSNISQEMESRIS